MSLIGEAILASINAMLKVVVVLLIGILSAHTGFLNMNFIPQLSNWLFIVLTPCLVLSNLARQLSAEKLATYWPVLVWGTYTIVLGYILGWMYCLIMKPRQEYKTTIISAITYNNAVSLPITVMDSLAASAIFSTDAASASFAFQQATAICFLTSIPWNLIMFAVGFPYMLELKPEPEHTNEDNDDESGNLADLSALNPPSDEPLDGYAHLAEIEDDRAAAAHPLDINIEDDPNYPSAPPLVFLSMVSSKCNRGCDVLGFLITRHILRHLSTSKRFMVTMMFTNPPLLTIFISFFLGLIPVIKAPLYDSDGALNFIIKAIDFVAQSSIPLSTLITAAGIYHSINRNFGRDARTLQRVIDTIEQVQKNSDVYESGNSQTTPQPRSPQTHHLSPPGYIDTHGDDLTRIDSDDVFVDHTFGHHTPQHHHHTSSASHPHAHPGSLTSPFAPTPNPGQLMPRNMSTLHIYQDDAPASSAMIGSLDGDMKLIHRTYSRIAPETTQRMADKQLETVVDQADTSHLTPVQKILARVDPSLPIDQDEHGNILPLPRLAWSHMLLVAIFRLVCVPFITFLTMLLVDALGWTALLPEDKLYRTSLLLSSASTSAEAVLMIITKGQRFRQSFMLSLVYVVQYGVCLFTIPIWLVLVIAANTD